jgi:hypothetical protein
MAQEMGLSIPLPLTHREFINREYEPLNISGFLIDDADELLQSMARGPILEMSITVGIP